MPINPRNKFFKKRLFLIFKSQNSKRILKKKLIKYFANTVLSIIFIFLFYDVLYAKQIEIIEGPPEGFEDIDKPKYSIVDIYYEGRFLGSVEATTTSDTIQFIKPQEVFKLLPPIKEDKKSLVLSRLRIKYNAKTNYICVPKKRSGCGYLNTNSLSVVYNDEFFIAEIILSSKVLDKEDIWKIRYLEKKSEKFNEIFKFGGYFYGNDNKRSTADTTSYNLNGKSITSYKQESYFFDVFYSELTKKTTFENIFVERYFDSFNIKAGTFGISNLRNIAQSDILGFSYYTDTNKRLDLEDARASEITVNLNYRSRVLIRKDNRIYHSEIYDQGIQRLDTRKLPSGSYDINIEIIDPSGNSRKETRFFVKRGELPLKDTPYLWFDIGALEEIPDRNTTFQRFENEYIARAGTFRKIASNYGLGGNIILNKDVSVAEAFVDYYRKYLIVGAGITGTTRTDYAYNFNYVFDKVPWTSNLTWRQSFYNSNKYNDRIYLFKPIGSTSKNLTFNVKRYILNGSGNIGLYYNYAKRNGQENYSYGPKLRLNIFRNIRGLTGSLEVGAFQTDLEKQLTLNLLVFYNQGHWQFFNSTGYDYRRNDDEKSSGYKTADVAWNIDNSLTWQDLDLWEDDLRLVARHNSNDGVNTTEGKLEYKSNYGRLLADTRNNRNNNDYSISFDTNIAYGDKKVVFGGKDIRESMVVIKIEGGSEKSEYDIYINNAKKQRIKVGKTKIIPLIPFKEYYIYLKPKDATTTYIDLKPKKIVLYPGNVVYLKYEAKDMGILIGTLYRGNRILRNTEIKGEISSTITDSQGFFQMEVLLNEELNINNRYKYKVPNKTDEYNLITIDKIKARRK